MQKIILAFDLGKRSGWYSNCEDTGEAFYIKNLLELHQSVQKLVEVVKPSVIVYPAPTRYYNVLRKHYQYIGVINLIAEKKQIQTIEVIDSRAKKVVLGKGKASKNEIIEAMGIDDSEVADAKMFCLWFLNQ